MERAKTTTKKSSSTNRTNSPSTGLGSDGVPEPILEFPPPVPATSCFVHGLSGFLRRPTRQELGLDEKMAAWMGKEALMVDLKFYQVDFENISLGTPFHDWVFVTEEQLKLEMAEETILATVTNDNGPVEKCQLKETISLEENPDEGEKEKSKEPPPETPADKATRELAEAIAEGDGARVFQMLSESRPLIDCTHTGAPRYVFYADVHLAQLTISMLGWAGFHLARAIMSGTVNVHARRGIFRMVHDYMTYKPIKGMPWHGCKERLKLDPKGLACLTAPDRWKSRKAQAEMIDAGAFIVAIVCEYNLALSFPHLGVKSLYARLSTLSTLITKLTTDIEETRAPLLCCYDAFDDAFVSLLVDLRAQLTVCRAELDVRLRVALGLGKPVIPGGLIHLNKMLSFRLDLRDLDLRPKEERVFTAMFGMGPGEVFDLIAFENKTRGVTKDSKQEKKLQETISGITACRDLAPVFGPADTVLDGNLSGKDIEFCGLDGLPWDQKALLLDRGEAGGRLGKTQTKGCVIHGTAIPVLAGLLLEATYSTTAAYELCWKHIYDAIYEGTVFIRRRLKGKWKAAILEVVSAQLVGNPRLHRRLLRPDQNSRSSHNREGSYGGYLYLKLGRRSQIPLDDFPEFVRKFVAKIVACNGRDDLTYLCRELHFDLRSAIDKQQCLYFEISVREDDVIGLDKEIASEAADLWRFIWVPHKCRMFWTFSHYEDWADPGRMLEGPAFCEILLPMPMLANVAVIVAVPDQHRNDSAGRITGEFGKFL